MLYIVHIIRYSFDEVSVEVVAMLDFSSVDLFLDLTREQLRLEALDDFIVNARESASGRIVAEFSMNTYGDFPPNGVDAPWVTVSSV